ncbi:MAG: DUF3099 domain-containing protein [Propionicimonas sp.]
MAGRRHKDDDVIRITTAAHGRGVDTATRERRYLISMGIRILCFIGAVAIGPGWLRWVLVAGAVFLPYLAVVAANAASNPDPAPDLPSAAEDLRHLGAPDPGDPTEPDAD